MDLKIIYDNKSKSKDFISGWGFSCLIGKDTLFDTGEKEESFSHNLKALDTKLSNIKNIIISHDHWDHTGALWGILEKNKGINVFICPHFSSDFKKKLKDLKANIIEGAKGISVNDQVFVTKEIETVYKEKALWEQAVVINTGKGLSVITGCAHPGIVNILEKVKTQFPDLDFYSVLGGFHLKNEPENRIKEVVNAFETFGIKKIGPAHCSGEKAKKYCKSNFENDFINISAGVILKI